MTQNNSVDFQMGYMVLRTLGKGLYSNPWAAISELVANSLDAKAPRVKIVFNYTNPSEKIADVYIIDHGKGMSYDDFSKYYIKIGHNKRVENPDYEDSDDVMGRKGIGKLAALYLTSHYEVISKRAGHDPIHYEADFSNYEDQDSPTMELSSSNEYLSVCTQHLINPKTKKTSESYTIIYMHNVKLKNYGEIAFESLAARLANYFAYDIDPNKTFLPELSLLRYNNSVLQEEYPLTKRIAFKNMLLISNLSSRVDFGVSGNVVKTGSKGKKHEIEVPTEVTNASAEDYSGEIQDRPYQLHGWLGLHSTINKDAARENDENYIKNNYYNPLQIRIYTRSKLAIENFQSYIKNTQTYGNYIEGELSFDILDDNELDDIATANRQDVDMNDERVQKLIELVESTVQELVTRRVALNKIIVKEIEEIEGKKADIAKTIFKDIINEQITPLDISAEKATVLSSNLLSQFKGETIKDEYSLFFSHASSARVFSDIIFQILLALGAKASEIFYTSEQTHGYGDSRQNKQLNIEIKNNIIHKNAMIVYFNYPSFSASEYCLFEGGAGWASRSAEDIHIITSHFNEIPSLLQTYDKFVTVLTRNLDRLTYKQLVSSINTMVRHLNKGRKDDNKIEEIISNPLPTDLELSRSRKNIEDHFDPLITEVWNLKTEEINLALPNQKRISEIIEESQKLIHQKEE